MCLVIRFILYLHVDGWEYGVGFMSVLTINGMSDVSIVVSINVVRQLDEGNDVRCFGREYIRTCMLLANWMNHMTSYMCDSVDLF